MLWPSGEQAQVRLGLRYCSAAMHCWCQLNLRWGVAAGRCQACLRYLAWLQAVQPCSQAVHQGYVTAAAVGILAAHCCHFKGAKKIIMVDSVPARLEVGLPLAQLTAALHQQHLFCAAKQLSPLVLQQHVRDT